VRTGGQRLRVDDGGPIEVELPHHSALHQRQRHADVAVQFGVDREQPIEVRRPRIIKRGELEASSSLI
jgi:hypothetical protein